MNLSTYRKDSSEFESVVVVKASHKRGIEGLKGLNYCHPGLHYDHSERWSERFLKHFERIITTPICNKDITSPAEIEIAALADVFKTACRPGLWSNNLEEDARLSEPIVYHLFFQLDYTMLKK